MENDILNLIVKLDLNKDSELISKLYDKYNSLTIPKKYMSKDDFDEDDIFQAKKGADTIIRSFICKLPETKKIKQAKRIDEEWICEDCKYRDINPVCKSCFRRHQLVQNAIYNYEKQQFEEARKCIPEDFIHQKMIIQKINQKLFTIKFKLKQNETSKQ